MRPMYLSLIAVVGAVALVPQRGAEPSSRCRHAAEVASSSRIRDSALLCELNLQRRRHGLSALRIDRRLRRGARDHAAKMAERGRLAHSFDGRGPGARLRSAGWRRGWGEVLAYGCSTLASPAAAVDGWLRSPGHRRLILDPTFRWVGVASAPTPRGGACAPELYWAADLGS